MGELKIKFRDELDRFAEKHFGSRIAKLNEKQRSDALTLCYLLEIRNALLPGAIPDDFEELMGYVCDGAYDRVVDFLYRDDNKHVTIIQSKHRGPDKTESESEFETFRNSLRRLCPETRANAKINQRLLDIASDIEWDTDAFTLIYLSLARHVPRIADLAERDVDDVPNSVLKDVSTRAEIRYLSEDEINKEWRDVVQQRTGANPTVEVLLAQPAEGQVDRYLVVENQAHVRSFLCVLSAQQIHQLYTRYRDQLFNLNIRNYVGDTRTNKEIIRSAMNEADSFFFYNNGISAVATKVTPKPDGKNVVLKCADFSVINGAQTFRSISKAHSRRQHSSSTSARVLLRVSEFDFRKPIAAEMLDNITRYNNTQNAMRVSDFRSNDPVQMSLVRYVGQVPAFGGKNYLYRNKRTQGGERNKIGIKMDEFCRAVYSYQFGPPDFFGGLSHLYDTSPDGGYVKLFGTELTALSQSEFDRLFGIWLITSHVADVLRDEKKQQSESAEDSDVIRKGALERKYLTFFALGEVVREICRLKKTEETDFLRAFGKPKWQDEPNKVIFLDEAFSLGCDMIVQAYQMAQAKLGFVHRNFFRDSETLSSIRASKASRKGQLQKLAAM